MKKLLIVVIALTLALGLAACSSTDQTAEQTAAQQTEAAVPELDPAQVLTNLNNYYGVTPDYLTTEWGEATGQSTGTEDGLAVTKYNFGPMTYDLNGQAVTAAETVAKFAPLTADALSLYQLYIKFTDLAVTADTDLAGLFGIATAVEPSVMGTNYQWYTPCDGVALLAVDLTDDASKVKTVKITYKY